MDKVRLAFQVPGLEIQVCISTSHIPGPISGPQLAGPTSAPSVLCASFLFSKGRMSIWKKLCIMSSGRELDSGFSLAIRAGLSEKSWCNVARQSACMQQGIHNL